MLYTYARAFGCVARPSRKTTIAPDVRLLSTRFLRSDFVQNTVDNSVAPSPQKTRREIVNIMLFPTRCKRFKFFDALRNVVRAIHNIEFDDGRL